MNAGTELNIEIEIRNTGNDMDLTAEAEFESKLVTTGYYKY